jgi:hypothetical protein
VITGLCQSHSFLLLFEKLLDEVSGVRTIRVPDGIIEVNHSFLDLLDSSGVVFRLEGGMSSDELVYGDAQCPDVDSLIVTAAEKYFRGLIEGRSYNGQHIPPHSLLEGALADAEVNDP